MSNENVKNEIANAARVLGMEMSEVEKKWSDICESNGLDPNNDWRLGLALLRQWFSGANAYKDAPQTSSSNDLAKTARGFFVSLDAARDMAEMQNNRIKGEYEANPDQTYAIGRVALVSLTDAGKYSVSKMEKGEEKSREFDELPKNSHEVEVNEWIIPLDNMPSYGTRTNPSFGKPLPETLFRSAGVFIGEVNGDKGLYYFSYKGESSKSFLPETFKMLEMTVIRDQNNTDRIYGFKKETLDSLSMVTDEQPTMAQIQESVMELAGEHYTQLVGLNMYHTEKQNEPYAKKFVITDGSVSSVNMTPNKFGTRRVTITDLNSDFDYEGGGWAGTTCWIPAHINIDFGIGSTVVIVGRTSQRVEDGVPGDATLNVSGLLVTEYRGSVVEPFETSEESDLDWF